MANDGKTLEILQGLAQAYGQTMTPAQVRLMAQALDGITPHALELAAAEYMRTSEWFPKAADLRKLALEYQGIRWGDVLEAEVHACEDKFYLDRTYNPEVIEHIAVAYDRAGKESKAAWVREKSRRWSAILEVEHGETNRTGASDTTARGLPAGAMAAGVSAGAGVV